MSHEGSVPSANRVFCMLGFYPSADNLQSMARLNSIYLPRFGVVGHCWLLSNHSFLLRPGFLSLLHVNAVCYRPTISCSDEMVITVAIYAVWIQIKHARCRSFPNDDKINPFQRRPIWWGNKFRQEKNPVSLVVCWRLWAPVVSGWTSSLPIEADGYYLQVFQDQWIKYWLKATVEFVYLLRLPCPHPKCINFFSDWSEFC